jgi:membrane-anchored protein YejM (alkaline phosphatase superfamily)
LRTFFLTTYGVVLALCWNYVASSPSEGPLAMLFSLAVLVTYGALYLAPAGLLTAVACGIAHLGRHGEARGWRLHLPRLTAVFTTAITTVLLLLDRRIHELFGFHLNGFVWNLITTPGGLESLESSDSARISAALRIFGLVLLQIGLLVLALRWQRGRKVRMRPLGLGLALVWLGVMIAQTLAYAFSQLHGFRPVVVAATGFPGYLPLTIRHLAQRWGFAPAGGGDIELGGPALALDYPLAPIEIDETRPAPNIVWLCAESLRADALDPQIMPETWALAERGITFERHYSSGNATRMGTFGMFYGLYASYWFAMLAERRAPVLMDVLRARGYRIEAWSSADFTYPEFYKTIFASLLSEALHPRTEGLAPHENDRVMVSELGTFVRAAGEDPFFAFLFFDATHARYTFREESVIRRPYAEEVDYVTMRAAEDVEPLKNRYWNACHDLDGRVGEVLRILEQAGRMKDTLLIFTGDHGQEFMEHGRWGHNSAFNDVQLRVPLILLVPGEAARRVTRLTSHLDLPATLLPRLGVLNPPEDYSLGHDLLGERIRLYTVAGSWSELGLIDAECKLTLPFRGAFLFQTEVTTADDEEAADPSFWIESRRDELVEVMRDMARFAR